MLVFDNNVLVYAVDEDSSNAVTVVWRDIFMEGPLHSLESVTVDLCDLSGSFAVEQVNNTWENFSDDEHFRSALGG